MYFNLWVGDLFGLPAENAAIQNGTHPAVWTKSNIENMKRQLKLIGFSYDLGKRNSEVIHQNTTNGINGYSKRMYEKGLIYKKNLLVNWCPDCQTVLSK